MASPIGSKGSLSIALNDKGSSIQIQISESAGIRAQNLSLSTWGASFILANLLHQIQLPHAFFKSASESDTDDKKPWILELGAGTGLVGLSAAAIWQSKVVLTDLPPIVPGLNANIALNETLLRQYDASVFSASLDWAHPAAIKLCNVGNTDGLIRAESNKPAIILAADTIYSEEHPELLSRTILTWLAPGVDSRVILCYPLRMAYIDHIREFWGLMEASGLECFCEGREKGGEEWNEISNTPYEWCMWRWKSN